MPEYDARHSDYPTLGFVLGAIADWINKYRSMTALRDEFRRCSPDEVRQIARDLGLPLDELRSIASRGPQAAAQLERMLLALGVDPSALLKAQPATMRDLQRLCVACQQKQRCERELADSTAAGHYRAYCPNAFTLDSLVADIATMQAPSH